MKPDISVIMPVYNSCKYVETAIKSVLKQSYENFELIIVDDGSYDNSYSICLMLQQHDKRIKLYTKENGGICNARNFGLQYAIGDYIAFIDHDDEWTNDLLEVNYKLALKYDADFVKFGKKYIYISENKYKEIHLCNGFAVYNETDILNEYLRCRYEGLFELVWDGLYRKAIIVKNELLFDTFFKRGGEDIDFNSRYIKYVAKLVINPGIYYNHYIRYGFSTSTKSSNYIVEAALEHPRRLFAMRKIGDEDSLFCLCFVKECLAVALKIGYHLCNGNYMAYKEFIESVGHSIFQEDYYFVVKRMNLLKMGKSGGLSFKTIYYLFLLLLFRNKKNRFLFLLLKLKMRCTDLS